MTNDLEARIRERAYHLWQQEGRVGGRELDHWSRAERELRSMHQTMQGAAEKPAAASKKRAASAPAASAKGRRPKGQPLHA